MILQPTLGHAEALNTAVGRDPRPLRNVRHAGCVAARSRCLRNGSERCRAPASVVTTLYSCGFAVTPSRAFKTRAVW